MILLFTSRKSLHIALKVSTHIYEIILRRIYNAIMNNLFQTLARRRNYHQGKNEKLKIFTKKLLSTQVWCHRASKKIIEINIVKNI